mgnify:CR=1 FL=1|tara:strand:+ start:585 stop:1088 length:504 start_codon:yes stop_codon:yes gene_type:complete
MAIPSDEELAKMSLPELEQLLEENYRSIEMLEQQEQPMDESAPASEPSPQMQMDEFEMGMTTEKVQSATAKLVQAGMLDAAAAEMTPDLIKKMQQIADQIDPGLYDLSQPDQLEEFINGINDGTIQLTPAAPAGQPADPVLQGAGGLPPGGLPPAGAGAAPAPAPII